jgi:hypothetical protein
MYHKSFESLSPIRSAEEKQKILASVGQVIWIKVTITQIKRDPKCDQHA